MANFLAYFPKENGLKFVTPTTSKNFTTFSTARREIDHMELALGATSRNVSFSVARVYLVFEVFETRVAHFCSGFF